MARATDAAGERQLVRIFISSPVDVRPERVIAERVIRRLDHEFSYHLRVEPYLWEREPLVASQSFQELIVRPSETDIVLVILWSRLGMLLDEAKFPGPISGRAVTGTEWEFEDALKSARERRLPDLLLYRKTEKPKGEFGDRAEVEERQHQTELVEEFMRRWTRDADGKAFTAASWVFSDTTDFQQQLHQHLTELLRKRVAGAGEANPATIRWHHGSPYRGLEPFEREHEQVFFGRTRARHEVRELLGQHAADGTAFVLLVGASGSGKSSLVKAGLLPELSHPGMMGSAALVRWAITRPGTLHGSGSTSLMDIADAILGDTALPELQREPFHYTSESLAALLGRSAAEAALPIRQGLGAAAAAGNLTARGEARLLLVVDQLEELFTADMITPEVREQYVAALDALASSGLVWVIATMRSDFFDRVADVPALKHLVSNRTYVLAPPEGPEIGEIIRQPAREAGLSFEVDLQTGRSLDQEIQQAASRDPDSLPLLEYLLDQLWQRRTTTGHLTFAAYSDLGGLEGAIGRRADAVLAAQNKDVQAAFAPVMRALVAGMQGKRAVARYALKAEFPKGGPEATLIRVFEDARLVVADGDRVRVSHEALLNHWPKARTQIEADARDLELRARLEQAAERWQLATRKHQKSMVLGPGLPLIEAVALLRRWGGQLSPAVRNFIIASRRALWRRRLKLSFGLAIAAAAVPGVALAVWAGMVWSGVRAIEAEMEFVDIPQGCAPMGSPATEEGREPDEPLPHSVCVGAFRLGKFELTQAQWQKVVIEQGNPSRYKGEDLPADKRARLPVENVSWEDAQAFVRRMSRFGTHDYRLATEPEWEYAARAHSETARYWGERIEDGCGYANIGDASLKRAYGGTFGDVAACDDGFAYTAPVGSFRSNDFGLYDMLGNVGEWVESCDADPGPFGTKTEMTDATQCRSRIARGGSFYSVPAYVRAAYRAKFPQDRRYANVGFRVVVTAKH